MIDSTTQPLNDSTQPQAATLVLDLGTTTLAGRLLAADGTVLAESRIANPQRPLGADILTRLQRAEAGAGEELQRLLVAGIRALTAELLQQARAAPEQVAAATAAGNPGICHLLLGLPVATLLHPPHRSPLIEAVRLPLDIFVKSLSGKVVRSETTQPLNDPTTQRPNHSTTQSALLPPHALTLFPAVSGFVGGDLVAVLFGASSTVNSLSGETVKSLSGKMVKLVTTQPLNDSTTQPFNPSSILNDSPTQRLNHSTQPQAATLVLDLGTNAELALWDGTRWLATSAAAGPAFEAGNISCGLPLAPGAVTDVQLSDDRLQLAVHGGSTPRGLCGSGLLALVAAAREGGLIDATGRIVAPDEVGTNLARYLVADGEGWGIRFHRAARIQLLLTQEDVRQLQLAKGAVRAGIDVLLDRAGLTAADIANVLLTGAFGAALPTAAVKGIALLPAAMLDKLLCVPNGVLDGLAAYITDPRGPERLKTLHAAIKPLPLSGTQAFERRFLAALEL